MTLPKRKSSRNIIYKCGDCHQEFPKVDLMVKKSVWVTAGVGGRTVRSRSIKFQCQPCREADVEWNREPLWDAPGMADVKEKHL
jgi:hypothetical protein